LFLLFFFLFILVDAIKCFRGGGGGGGGDDYDADDF
jgi:hypothetical protein